MPPNKPSLPTVLILGLGYSGSQAAYSLQGKANVIIVERKEYFDHCVATLRSYASEEHDAGHVLSLKNALTHSIILQGEISRVTETRVELDDGIVLEDFDFLIIATGSKHATRLRSITFDEARKEVEHTRTRLQSRKHMLIVGAGPTGVELAGEIMHFIPQMQISMVSRSEKFCESAPNQWMRDKLHEALHQTNPDFELILGHEFQGPDETWKDHVFTFLDEPFVFEGREIDVIANAATTHSDISIFDIDHLEYSDSTHARIKVEATMQVCPGSSVFAIGDIADCGHPTLAFAGIEQAKICTSNILALANGAEHQVKNIKPLESAMVVPFGPQSGFSSLPVPGLKKAGPIFTRILKSKGLFTRKTSKTLYGIKSNSKTRIMQASALEALNRLSKNHPVDPKRLLNVSC